MYKHYNSHTKILKSSHLGFFHKQLKKQSELKLENQPRTKFHPTENTHNSQVFSFCFMHVRIMLKTIHTAHLKCIFRSMERILKPLPPSLFHCHTSRSFHQKLADNPHAGAVLCDASYTLTKADRLPAGGRLGGEERSIYTDTGLV